MCPAGGNRRVTVVFEPPSNSGVQVVSGQTQALSLKYAQ
jgi:hypothetical protein